MPIQTDAQKIGSAGHKWLAAVIAEHKSWISRDLDEDYGIDMEAEVVENHEVTGQIIKIQVKSSEMVEIKDNHAHAVIDRKYLQYADQCRYPVIFVVVDLSRKEAWYLWLQELLMTMRMIDGRISPDQKTWSHWIPVNKNIQNGLAGELQSIAKWEGETQLVLSLHDALRAAAAIHNEKAIGALGQVIDLIAPKVTDISLNILITEAIRLGDRMWGTREGNAIGQQLYDYVRKYGERVSVETIDDLVIRGESYSRTGLNALAILYDTQFERLKSFELALRYREREPRVAFYCAFREKNPNEKSGNIDANPGDLRYAGMKYIRPDMHWDKYINRGASALLDYLVADQ